MGVVLLVGCVQTRRMTRSQVAHVAGKAAATAGFRLADYREPDVRRGADGARPTWTVFYEGNVPLPGNHFLVLVDDSTGSTQVMQGE